MTKRETKKAVQLKSKRERMTDELCGGIFTGEELLTEHGFGLLAGMLLGFAMAGGFDKSKTSDVGSARVQRVRSTTEKAN